MCLLKLLTVFSMFTFPFLSERYTPSYCYNTKQCLEIFLNLMQFTLEFQNNSKPERKVGIFGKPYQNQVDYFSELYLTLLFVSLGPQTFSTRTQQTRNLKMRNPPSPSNMSLTLQVRENVFMFSDFSALLQLFFCEALHKSSVKV